MADVPPLTTLPDVPSPSDNGALLCIVIAPALISAFILLFSCIGDCDGDVCIIATRSSARLRRWQGVVFWVALVLTSFAIGLANVHTARAPMAAFYASEVVPNWIDKGGQAVFQNLSTFYLTSTFTHNDTPDYVYFKPLLVPVVPTGHVEGLPMTGVFSVVQELDMSYELFRNYSGEAFLESLIRGGYQTDSSLYLASYHSNHTPGDFNYVPQSFNGGFVRVPTPGQPGQQYWNQSATVSLACSEEFCTRNCARRRGHFYGSCSIANRSTSPMIVYCEKTLGGRARRIHNISSCQSGYVCIQCNYQRYLQSTCYCVARKLQREWTVRAPGLQPCPASSTICGGEKWVFGEQFDPELMKSVSIRLMSVEDPALLLAQVTGSDTFYFPVSSEDKYRKPAVIVGAVAGACMFVFFALLMYGEEICWCDPESRVRYFFETGVWDDPTDSDSDDGRDEAQNILGRQHSNDDGGALYGSTSSSADMAMLCQICYAKPRNTKFKACKHHLACAECAEMLVKRGDMTCPLCRASISDGFESCPIGAPTYAAFSRSNSGGGGGGDGKSDASLNSSSSDNNRLLCMVCMTQTRSTRFECGHSSCCADCAQLVISSSHSCPLCRARVQVITPCNAREPTFVNLNASHAGTNGSINAAGATSTAVRRPRKVRRTTSTRN